MIDIRIVSDRAERAAAFAIRRTVFCGEQGISEAAEFDEHDATAEHVVAGREGRIEGTLRWRLTGGPDMAKIERVAVLREARGHGVASAMLAFLLARLNGMGISPCILNAQVTAMGLYRRHGFIAEGAIFQEEGIDHVTMRRDDRV